MAAGDIVLKQERYADAHAHFKECERTVESYGGEAHGYQIERLSLACIGMGNLEKADEHYRNSSALAQIPACQLY